MNIQIKPLTWEDQSDAVVTFHVTRNQIGMSYVVTVENLMTFVHSGSREVARFPALAVDAAKAAAQTDYETRILSALVSSPGKDGGQEVEAVAAMARRYMVACGISEEKATAVALLLERTGLLASPQPASTALVERLTKALEPFARIADMEEKLPDGASTMVNVSRCRDASTALASAQSTSRKDGSNA